jgi:hypothetical protein
LNGSGPDCIQPSTNVHNLGVYLDSDLTMRSHVQRTAAACFAVLRQLHSVRHSVPASAYQTLAVMLVLPKLDYGNATLIESLVFQPTSMLGSSLCWTQPHGPSLVCVISITSLSLIRWPASQLPLAARSSSCMSASNTSWYTVNFPRITRTGARLPVVLSASHRWQTNSPFANGYMRSAASGRLDGPSTGLKTVGDRAFSVAGPRLWNN